MANINVKRVDLTKRYEDKDLLIAPRTILDQVAINGSHNPETGEDIPGIDNTPAFIYDGKKPKNLNDALKNLAENVKGSIGSSGILQIKRGPDGTPEDPDTSGIYTFPVATDTQLGIITKADVKQIADDEDDARDAKRPTVDNKVMTGVATDGTGEYYDLGTKLTAPSANKVFTGFKGGDINDPQWESIKTTVAPKPFTGTWTDPTTGETYGPDNIGLATSYIDTLTKNIKIYEDESLTPSPTNTYTGVRDDTAGTLTITIPKAEGKVKDVQINNTSIVDADGNAKITVKDTYDAAGTDAISGKGVKDALDTLDVAEVGQAGKYIQKIKQEDGKITATLADVKDTYTATDTEPISGKGVADALSDLELEETGGTDKIITMVKQEDGKVTATAKTAVEKVATPATTNAYEYKIADASVKVELPKATDTDYGEILLDKDKIDSASTAKTDDPKLMTGKAIEDSLAVKKVNGNASIYAYNSTVPAVDNAIVLGAGATATAEGAVVVGSGASAASKNDVAIGAGAATAADGGIAIGENATAAATKAISMGLGAQARSESSIAIGTAAKSVKETAIALGSTSVASDEYSIAIGNGATTENLGNIAIGAGSKAANFGAIAIGGDVDDGSGDVSGGAQASEEMSMAIGQMANAAGMASMAIGAMASAQTQTSIAIGMGAQAIGESSMSIGVSDKAIGQGSMAIGLATQTSGQTSIGIGMVRTGDNAESSIVIGNQSLANKKHSVTIGNKNTTNGEYAVNIGYLNDPTNDNEISLGKMCKNINSDDPVIATHFTVGNGESDGDGYKNGMNMLEQKQNADLYIPGIGGFDGTNSSPYDYELDDEGNPKINNDGNPIKKVRPLQESIVEDVVMPMPKEGSGGGIVLNNWQSYSTTKPCTNIMGDPFGRNPLVVDINPTPSEAPTVHLTGSVSSGCSLAWCMWGYIDEIGEYGCTAITMSSLGSETYSDPMDIPFPEDVITMTGMTYSSFIAMTEQLGLHLGFAIFGNDDAAKAQTRDNITVTMLTTPEKEEVIIDSGNTFSWKPYPRESKSMHKSESRDGFTLDSPPMMRIKNAGYLLDSYPGAAVGLVAEYMGSTTVISSLYQEFLYLMDLPDPNDILMPNMLWSELPSMGIDPTVLPISIMIDNVPEDADLSGITYDFIILQNKVEYEDKSIVKEHIAHLPFIDQIKSDSEDYDVPNVKAVKQVRKEIEDEILFVKGNGVQSIKSKLNGEVANGDNSFAVGCYALEMEGSGVEVFPAKASGVGAVAIGGGTAEGQSSLAMQFGVAQGSDSIAIGADANATNMNSIVIGRYSIAAGEDSIAIGINSRANGTSSLVLGNTSYAYNANSTVLGRHNIANAESTIAIGVSCHTNGDYSIANGANLVTNNEIEVAIGSYNVDHKNAAYVFDDSTQFSIGFGHYKFDDQHPQISRNLQEATYDGKLYVYGIGGYDGIASDSTKWGAYKKNADGTDYINPLTSKKEHEYYKPLQEVIELMDARIKYLEDIIDQLTQQRNPVEP